MYFVFLAQGFEEMEALAPVDIMRRAGIEVYTVGVGSKVVTGAHGIPVTTDVIDCEISPDDDFEGIILPGGMPGTLNLEKAESVDSFLKYADENGKLIAAICAAPSVLGHKGMLKGKKAVCFTGFEEQLTGAEILSSATACDGNIITGCGAGAAVKFGLELVKYIRGDAVSEHHREALLCNR